MTNPTAPSPFAPTIPNFQTAWDSTSISWLKTCPKLYHYQMVEGWSPKSKSVHLKFGGWYASGVERYAHLRAAGTPHNTAVLSVVRWVLAETWLPQHDPTCPRCAGTGLATGADPLNDPPTTCPCLAPRGWESGDETKNRYTLVRTLVWNLDDRESSPWHTVTLANGKPAVELSFNFHAFDLDEHAIHLCGHMDEIVDNGGQRFVKDDKAQPIWCKVLTPTGWTRIGDLKVGDLIAAPNGSFYPITALHPKGIVPTYKVRFGDWSTTYCAEDHLWQVTVNGKQAVINFKDLIKDWVKARRSTIPSTSVVQHPEAVLPLDPYLLGVLLGDGYLAGNSIQLTTSNDALIQKVQASVDRMGDILRKNPADNLCWTITNNRKCATLAAIKTLDLKDKLSRDKFVPPLYLFASPSQRWAVLEGLLDTDGSRAGVGRRYQTMSPQLAEDVASLVRSLGGSAAVTVQPRRMFRVSIRLSKDKLQPRKRFFHSYERGPDASCICIEVASPDHLYLTDDHIVTHNTTKSALTAHYFAGYTPDDQMTLYTLAGKIILGDDIQGVLVRAAQIGVGFARFATQPISRPKAILEEWLSDLRWWVGQARNFALTNHWPMNQQSCSKYSGCAFRKVCSVSPSHRKAWLEQDFEKRLWNPLQARGDDL